MMAKVGLVACFDLQTALDAAAAQGEDTVTLLKDVTVPAGKEVEIPAGVTLIIPEGKTLTNNGTLTSLGTVDGGGSFTNNGTYKETAAAKIADTVEFTNNGDTALVYAVTFAADGNVVDIVAVDPGADVDLPTIPEKVGCTAVWNHDGRNITADTVIRAEYTMIPTSDPEPTPNPEAAPIPETGDGMGVYLFAGLVLISLLGMAMLRKREA